MRKQAIKQHQTQDTKLALIYGRVSSKKQVIAGDGLNSQLTACLNYAETKGYEVVGTFTDDLGSGLVDHSQKMTVAARATAEKKAVGQRS